MNNFTEMPRRKATKFSHVNYSPIDGINGDDFTNEQFRGSSVIIPWKAIGLAGVLCFGGFLLLTIGTCIIGGWINSKYEDRMWPVIILGCLMFIPGAYHMRIAFCAFRHISGYSFEDIPEFE